MKNVVGAVKRTGLAAVAALSICATATPAAAQICAGRGSFADAPWQARIESSYSNSSKTFGPSITRGSSTVFIGAVADLVGYPTLDQAALSLGGTIGADGAIGRRASRVHGCPIMTLLHTFGPNVPGVNFSANIASVGGRIGVVASENATLQVVPTFGMDVQYEHDIATSTDAAITSTSSSRTFTVTRFGVGFVLNRKTTITPEIVQIYGVAADTTLRVTASFGFGTR